MKLAAALFALTLAGTATGMAQKEGHAPVAFGMLGGQTGFVIFAEDHRTRGRFYGVAVTTKTVGRLTLVDAQNYTFDQKEVLETQESMDRLMRLAQKDKIKFVKIPEKYSPELLEKARAACKAEMRRGRLPAPYLLFPGMLSPSPDSLKATGLIFEPFLFCGWTNPSTKQAAF